MIKKFFAYHPDEGIIGYFQTIEEALDELNSIIEDEKDIGEGWRSEDEMAQFFVGQKTHIATMKNLRIRPEQNELDENNCDKNGEDWSHGFDEMCDYIAEPIK